MSDITKDQLIAALNEDLALEFTAVLQYLTYAAKVSGPSRPELKAFFEAEIPDETGHAQFLAANIVALTGVKPRDSEALVVVPGDDATHLRVVGRIISD